MPDTELKTVSSMSYALTLALAAVQCVQHPDREDTPRIAAIITKFGDNLPDALREVKANVETGDPEYDQDPGYVVD
jgi:hypothetical protein